VTTPTHGHDPADVPEPIEPGPLSAAFRPKKPKPEPLDAATRREIAAVVAGGDPIFDEPITVTTTMRFALDDVPQGLRAARMEGEPIVWRIIGPIWATPPVTASSDAAAASSKARRARRKSGTARIVLAGIERTGAMSASNARSGIRRPFPSVIAQRWRD
jgi:hypothetical protein